MVSVVKVSSRRVVPREISNSEKRLITKLHNDVMADAVQRARARSSNTICIMHDNFTAATNLFDLNERPDH